MIKYPTLLAAAGIDINKVVEINYTLDGVNQWDGIRGNITSNNNNNLFRQSMYYGLTTVPYLKYDAVQHLGYKLINTSGGGPSGWFPPPTLTKKQPLEFNEYDENNATKFLLFDLINDPTEHHDISSNYSNITQQLYQILIDFEQTGVPQNVPDPHCPEPTYMHLGPPYGNAYIPWCDGYP